MHDLGNKPKAHRQTPRSNAKIPLLLCLQASLPPHPAGENEEGDRKVREKRAEASKVC